VVDCERYTVCGGFAAYLAGGGCGGTGYVDKETHENQLKVIQAAEDVLNK
jgi:hypothetical protein